MDMNFIFSCSTRYLTSERSERVGYRVDHSKIKFISTRGHVISSMYLATLHDDVNFFMFNKRFEKGLNFRKQRKNLKSLSI